MNREEQDFVFFIICILFKVKHLTEHFLLTAWLLFAFLFFSLFPTMGLLAQTTGAVIMALLFQELGAGRCLHLPL